jgi:PAS domain-containing protein
MVTQNLAQDEFSALASRLSRASSVEACRSIRDELATYPDDLGLVSPLMELAAARMKDLAALEQARARATEAEMTSARWERLVDDAPAPIGVHRGPRHAFAFANRHFLDTTDGRQIVGLDYAEAFPEFVEQGYLQVFDHILQTGEPFISKETRADTPRRRGGEPEERYWNAIFQVTRDAEGDHDGLVTFAFEVTEQVMARREAEAARQRLVDLARAVGALVWEMETPAWRPLWVEGRPEGVLGCSAEEAGSRAAWWAGIHPEDEPEVSRCRAEASERGEYSVEYRRGSDEGGWH